MATAAITRRVDRWADRTAPWRPVVAAMAKSGGGAIASGLLSALGAKIVAVMLGPPGLALVATLQQTRDAAVLAATANGRTALVRGMSALDGAERREYLRTVLLIFAGGLMASACTLVLAHDRVARWAGLPPDKAVLLAWLAAPVILTSACSVLGSLANVLGEIGKLAWSQVLASAVMAAGAWPMARSVQSGSYAALDVWLTVTATASIAIALWTLAPHRANLKTWFDGPGTWWSWSAARQFFSISAAMLATGFLGSAVLVALRARMVRVEGLGGAGLFDAAWAISMGHVSLVLASMQTYYLPALARARGPSERCEQIARVLMVATVVMAPLVAVLEVARPLLLTTLYSASFQPSATLLRWTLVGDYLKVTSWVLAMPMLAVADVKIFLATDIAGQSLFALGAIALAGLLKPSESTAIAFLVSCASNLVICYVYAQMRHGFRPSRTMAVVWWTGLALVATAAASTGS